MSGIDPKSVIDIIISKSYDIQAFSLDPNYTDGFVKMLGGPEECMVIRTIREKINVPDEKIISNLLYEFDEIWVTREIDYKLDDFLQEVESEVVGHFHTMLGLLEFYKFTEEENRFVERFTKTYDYNFLRDCHGFTAYDYKEYLNTKLLMRKYLSNNRRTKE